MYDVIIAGGGIAGLSAALILGRCRRKIIVYDSGRPRNAASRALHGFISRDGVHPLELREMARRELAEYPSVGYREGEVVDAEEMADGYRVTLADGSSARGKYLLIATGVVDVLPPIAGAEELYGRNVFHCPYCDGWEVRDQPLAVYGAGETGYEYALELTGWSRNVVLCTDGGESPSAEQLDHLRRQKIGVVSEKIVRLEEAPRGEVRIRFVNEESLVRRALFFNPDQYQASPLAEKLRCEITEGGVVNAGKLQQIKPRLFIAGDAARSVQLAIVAAAEGAEAAFALNSALLKEDVSR